MRHAVIAVLCWALFAPAAIAQEAPPSNAPGGEEMAVSSVQGAEAESDGSHTLSEYFEYGGWIMWALVAVSIFSVAVMAERAIALRRSRVAPVKFQKQVRDHWHRREIAQAMTLCSESNNAIARVLKAGLLHVNDGLARMQDAVEVAGDREATLLRRNLPLLATLANIATMLGLLGTVLGMIQSFELIAQTGTGDARVVAGGIFQALVTTAAGLIVGLVTIFMHMVFKRKVDMLVIDLEEKSFRMLEDLEIHGGSNPSAVPPSDLAPAEA